MEEQLIYVDDYIMDEGVPVNELSVNNKTSTAAAKNVIIKANPTRRQWSEREKTEFLLIMRDLVHEGIKTDNSFKPAMLKHCVERMEVRVPGCKVTQEHARNKLIVWKRDYCKVHDLTEHSGFGWDEAKQQVEVEDEDVWDNYVRVHPEAEKVRDKCWPLFKQWEVIFGKDRAKGDTSKNADDSLARMERKRAKTLGVRKRRPFIVPGGIAFTEGSGTSASLIYSQSPEESVTTGNTTLDPNRKKAKPFTLTPKNLKNEEVVQGGVIHDMIKEFLAGANTNIVQGFDKLSEAVKPTPVVQLKEPTKAELVVGFVNGMNLEKSARLCATARIATNPYYMDFFLAIPDEDKRDFVNNILTNKM